MEPQIGLLGEWWADHLIVISPGQGSIRITVLPPFDCIRELKRKGLRVGQPYRGKLPQGFQLSTEDKEVELREDDRGRFYAVYETAMHPKVAAAQVRNRPMSVRFTESEAALVNMGWEIARSKGLYGKKASRSDMMRYAAIVVAKIAIEGDENDILPVNSVLARFELESQMDQHEWEQEALSIMQKSLDNAIDSGNEDKWDRAIESARTIFRECTSIPTQNKMLELIQRAEKGWERR